MPANDKPEVEVKPGLSLDKEIELRNKAKDLKDESDKLKKEVEAKAIEIDRLVNEHKQEIKNLREGRSSKPVPKQKKLSRKEVLASGLSEFFHEKDVEEMIESKTITQLEEIIEYRYNLKAGKA